MKVTLQYAERQLRHWTKKVEELRLTSNASNTKENEKGKESFPPDPLIEKREEQEKDHVCVNARTREGDGCEIPDDPDERREKMSNHIPTLELALEWAKTRLTNLQCTPEIVREWYDDCVGSGWCDKEGNAIHNWARNLTLYARYHKDFKRNKASDRPSGTAFAYNRFGRRPVNWKPTDPSQLKGAF